MRSASVGQHCVECVREGQKGGRQAKTPIGANFLGGGALVTKALVAINIVLFLVELAKPSLGTDWAMLGYATYGGAWHGVAAGEWYRLITSAFLPPAVTGGAGVGGLGLLDIAFNMYALIIVGPSLEQALGRWRFSGVYLLSALGGSVMYYYLAPQNTLALGASGAIFGLFGAWFVVARRAGADARGITALIAINLVLSFVFRGTIAWQAHVGGLLTGVLATAAYVYAPRKNRTALQVAAIVAVAVVAVIIRTHQLTS